MKRNSKVMRIAVVLVALVLATSCFVGSTFAKYVTKGEASDSARVAKFGVEIDTDDFEIFSEDYDTDDATYSTDITTSVETSVDGEKLVAPGTAGDFGSFGLTGTPEVAVKVEFSLEDVVLTGWLDENNDFYCPLNITIGSTTVHGLLYDSADKLIKKLETVVAKELDDNAVASFAPNTDLSTDYTAPITMSWEWPFESGKTADEIEENDVHDTFLGDEAADGNASEIEFKFNVKVTQID